MVLAHIHQAHGCAGNNNTSAGRLQVSKDISRKRNFPLLFCPLKPSSPALLRAGWVSGAPRQLARNGVSSPALLSTESKAGNLQWVQELRADMESWKELGKQRLISGKGMFDVPVLLKLSDIKSTGLFYYFTSEPSQLGFFVVGTGMLLLYDPMSHCFITLFNHHFFAYGLTACAWVRAEWHELAFIPRLDPVTRNEDIFSPSWIAAILSCLAGASSVLSRLLPLISPEVFFTFFLPKLVNEDIGNILLLVGEGVSCTEF